jgi:spore maturation protein CgeB
MATTVNEKKVWHRGRGQLISFLSANLKFKHISGEKDTIDQSYLYNRTKYNLAISYPMVCGTSNRLYNILASGGFCMAKQFPEIELLFEKGKHLQWFQEKEEILDMVDFYNKNPLKHEKVKLNGLKLYLEKHTAEKRMQNALDIMQGKTTQFYGYL